MARTTPAQNPRGAHRRMRRGGFRDICVDMPPKWGSVGVEVKPGRGAHKRGATRPFALAIRARTIMLARSAKSAMPDPSHSGSFLLPILVFLAAAVLAVPLFRAAGMGAVIGYLAAGVVIGPHALGLIGSADATLPVAELGVVLLLFIIGLELNPSRALAMRKDMAMLGLAQMVICSILIGGAIWLFGGVNPRGAALAGVALSFSGTAIALQILEERGAVNSAYGRRSFAILIAQDILVVPVLAIVPLLADGGSGGGDWRQNLLTFGGIIGAFAAVIFAGRYAINPFFGLLARSGAREVMTAGALFVVLGAAVLMNHAGMSMALGAFLAGLLLSESHFRHQLEADIEPFRGMLMGLFFMSVGMSIDLGLVASNAALLAGAALGVLAVKALVIYRADARDRLDIVRSDGGRRRADVGGRILVRHLSAGGERGTCCRCSKRRSSPRSPRSPCWPGRWPPAGWKSSRSNCARRASRRRPRRRRKD